jgi:alpha-1,3-rhamnosyl/mannosyltransferase
MRSRIVLLGRVTDLALDDLYANAAAVVYPSLDEGFGFPILEAMSHGVPVLGSNRGSIPEIAGGAAILFDPMDVEAMSESIDRIVSDEELRGSHIRKGLEQCALFTWEATADALIELYVSLIDDSSSRR